MARVAITEQYLTDIADAIRSKTGSSTTYLPSEMAPAILTISGSGGITPIGTINIIENGTYNVTNYASASVSVPTGSTINNQNKSVTPTESSQSITYDSGYTGLGTVTVGAISSTYVGSGITTNPTPTASGATVTIPAGYYSTQTTKSVSSGTAGTPTASKGTVSNHAVSVTPSVTNTAGYISGGTKTGTAVTISASELVSGNKAISSNGTNIDVTNYATVSVSVPTGSTISNQDKTVNPSTSQQQITADEGYTGLGTVTINAMPSLTLPTSIAASATSGYTKKATVGRSTSTQYINIGTGYNAAGGYYEISAVANGTEGTPTATKGAVSNHSISITPSVTNTAGYISGGTHSGAAVSVSASELVSGNKSISANGTNIDVTNYATVSVNVSSGGITPTGNIDITQSGTTDVTDYATATVPSADIYPWYDSDFTTQNGVLKFNIEAGYSVNSGGWVSSGDVDMIMLDAVPSNTTITPSTSSQTIGGVRYVMQGPITISAMPTMTLPTSAAASATSGYTSKATISRSTSDQYINIAPGYNSAGGYYKISAVANGSATAPATISGTSATLTTGTGTLTLTKTVSITPSVTAGYVSSGTAGNSSVSLTASVTIDPTPTASGATVTIPAGYYTAQTTKSVTSGSATGPSTVSGTSATVSTGTNTLTLTKTGVSTTPTVSAGYVSSATSSTATVSLTASVTTKAAATYHPSTTDQTISASQYLTGAQTIKAVTITNLTAANIKKDVVVKIGDATDDDCVTTITGTYEGSGGGAALTVDTSTTTLNSAAASISFTGLAGEPTSFAVVSAADLATGASPWKTAAVVFDGTDLHGQTIRNTSNAQVSYDDTAFSKTYSNGTLTITGSGTNFQANQYKLVYTYGGSDIGTADVQVGSGATTITFTGLSKEPSYFSCIFKSNFSTSSGYQRAIVVVYDGTNTYGLEMDSGAHDSDTHWSYTYNNGSLTITSQSTNAGGYFHQPGYYQLTYATEGEGGNYQSKTVYATSSQQVVQADSGYDALKKITIPAVTTTNLSASNILSGVTIQVGDAADSDRIASVTGNVVLQNYYTGSSAPSSSTGSNGDLYLQT